MLRVKRAASVFNAASASVSDTVFTLKAMAIACARITLGGIADNAVSRRYCSASGGRKSSAAGTGNRDSTTARP